MIANSIREMSVATGLNQDECLELYRIFFMGFDATILSMIEYSEQSDYQEIMKASHKLIGTFANIHLKELKDLSCKIEQCAKNQVDCLHLIEAVRRQGELLQKELLSIRE